MIHVLIILSLSISQSALLSMRVYTIKLGEDSPFYLDLPLCIGQDTRQYRATLGHKANHSFRPNCR